MQSISCISTAKKCAQHRVADHVIGLGLEEVKNFLYFIIILETASFSSCEDLILKLVVSLKFLVTLELLRIKVLTVYKYVWRDISCLFAQWDGNKTDL